MEDVEVACINLRILGTLQPNQRLYTRGLYFSISTSTFLPEFVHRWAYGENREHAITRIRKLMNTVESCLRMDCHHSRNLLTQAKKGIICLQDTYSSCATTKAQLEQILFRVDNLLEYEQVVDNASIDNACSESSDNSMD